ncbi:bifunctional cobalt-precorrin-7 (C(5))-methyltransferase/cobalt-precorrin-6B (C(15))-methyltransferase [Ruminococcus gauvreauii]|uniref:Bifunctional cobalt-precorrin-7 (C(5))-methyltransferase/cobalt-precorrin-6B (C(15))-methyltransferase n=1 Tax=Ruminococcus gauvreauii TaxID=438033 RepID=A0ABY5VHN3_9FIRM|nr:bifunctional cobalt-precorrin-7 (C(5))-methyltransferase/cobalt-precorrin-6B (C(15))-methyltransferase [Ruminococcus gauvreauii]UWP59741.1 bifunctional cobalt-precorrin-7 (C(5))-methyltransferase/cobalt-precorrin-6B (C(15))-methyltransferase [Ruminococcus gauvreauii]
MSEVLIFAGTLEGRTIAEFLSKYHIETYVCVATQYGESLLPKGGSLKISHERLDRDQMKALMERENPRVVIDATHPYAAEVTANIRLACEAAKKPYLRLLRSGHQVNDKDVVYVDSVADAVAYLQNTQGNVLATTGSKELAEYTKLADYRERVYARVLSLPEVAVSCAGLGFEGKHLICMQGPFSKELNIAMLRQLDCRYLVTKESGNTGGFLEKYEAARQTGATLVLIGRPLREEGMTLAQCRQHLRELFCIPVERRITLVGIGMGPVNNMTKEAYETCREAQLLIGARRMTQKIAEASQEVFHAYRPQEIADYIDAHPEFEKIAIALSGDVGFYSGAKKLLEVLPDGCELIPGVSSMIYFLAQLKKPWEDVTPCSMHGRSVNIVSMVKECPKVFAIVGDETGIGTLCTRLCGYGLGDVRVSVGERLAYPNEQIWTGTAEEFSGCKTDALSVVLIENEKAADHIVTHGIPDSEFLRDKAPMTKEEIRDISLSKLRLKKDSVIYDVGAGTGSVSVEMALKAACGHVYAIEKKPEAVALLHRNKEKFAVDHLEIIEGLAPHACEELPAPTHAFIGGSSGNLKEIMQQLLSKNPSVRMVINCITLETVAEALDAVKTLPVTDIDIASVSIGKSKSVGRYHMMMGQNPVYVISCEGGEAL